ncbi:hypothetical protein E6Q11_02675 [Candidatus Dojkabacteria bacterium]|uniref:Uncharacterized protein n=1 Tax=Candidatus Dojkabacteria bacterium TaxID=2099670 RepID=A0A5C7J7N6_9BACT|nr:MAG: hypothetical protein E6Q11_02675 [Candidatus Dojkabacteria bacterium]
MEVVLNINSRVTDLINVWNTPTYRGTACPPGVDVSQNPTSGVYTEIVIDGALYVSDDNNEQ